MGFYVNIEAADWLLPKEHYDEALWRLKEMNKPQHNEHKRGGGHSNGSQQSWWYSWMPEDYDKKVDTVRDVLEQVGFDVTEDDQGLWIIGYDSKTGNEDKFLQNLAGLVRPESWIAWKGEDGSQWRWTFTETTMDHQDGIVRVDYGPVRASFAPFIATWDTPPQLEEDPA